MWQTHSKHHSGEKLKAFPLRSGTRQGCPLSPLLIQHSFGSPSHGNQRGRRNPNWKRRSKLSLCADDMILHIENPKDATRKLLELINKFGKGCRIQN